jgi:hypothetical protein
VPWGDLTRKGARADTAKRETLRVLSLNDSQLALVMTAAGGLAPEKRSVFLERIAALLQLHGSRFDNADLDRAVRLALFGLIQNPAA